MDEKLPVVVSSGEIKSWQSVEAYNLPSEDREVFLSTFGLLAVGLKRDKVYSKLVELARKEPSPLPEPWRYGPERRFFENIGSLREVLKKDFFSPNLGVTGEGDVFVTTRDGWEKGLGGPRIKGAYKDGLAQIRISYSSEPMNPFASEVLPDLGEILLRPMGKIMGVVASGVERELTSSEKVKLAEILKGLMFKASRVFEANKKLLGKYGKKKRSAASGPKLSG